MKEMSLLRCKQCAAIRPPGSERPALYSRYYNDTRELQKPTLCPDCARYDVVRHAQKRLTEERCYKLYYKCNVPGCADDACYSASHGDIPSVCSDHRGEDQIWIDNLTRRMCEQCDNPPRYRKPAQWTATRCERHAKPGYILASQCSAEKCGVTASWGPPLATTSINRTCKHHALGGYVRYAAAYKTPAKTTAKTPAKTPAKKKKTWVVRKKRT